MASSLEVEVRDVPGRHPTGIGRTVYFAGGYEEQGMRMRRTWKRRDYFGLRRQTAHYLFGGYKTIRTVGDLAQTNKVPKGLRSGIACDRQVTHQHRNPSKMAFVSDKAIFKCGICHNINSYFKLGRSKRREHVTRWDTIEEDGNITQLKDDMLICVYCEVECRIKEMTRAGKSAEDMGDNVLQSTVRRDFRRTSKGERWYQTGQALYDARKWIKDMKDAHTAALMEADFVVSRIAVTINQMTFTSIPRAPTGPMGIDFANLTMEA